MITEIAQQLSESAFGIAVQQNAVLFPWLESIHVIAITLVFGCIAIVDLRLFGLTAMQHAVSKLSSSLLPLTWLMFIIALVTGFAMFVSAAESYLNTTAFVIKMVLILLAGINMIMFHSLVYGSIDEWNHSQKIPVAARLAGVFSLSIWLGVLIAGRFIGFTISHF